MKKSATLLALLSAAILAADDTASQLLNASTPQLVWEDVPPTSTVSQIVQQFAPRTSLAPATNYTDSATNGLGGTLRAEVAAAATAATNFTSQIRTGFETGEYSAALAGWADNAGWTEKAYEADYAFELGRDGSSRSAETIFSQIDARTTTNDVCSIVTNTVSVDTGEFGPWEFSVSGDFEIVEEDISDGPDPYWEYTLYDSGQMIGGYGWSDRQTVIDWGDFFTGLISTRARIVVTRNALGLARLVDLPTNHVTRAEMEEAIDAIPEVDLSRLATKGELAAVSNESALVTRLFTSSNVILEVTNYNSAVNSPKLRLLQLDESNTYHTVWTETNNLMRTLETATNYTDRAVSDAERRAASAYAPRAWSGVTSGLGVEAPSNTTWISTPTTVIAGGLEYTKVVDSGGAIWVLSGNGMMQFDPTTNAYLRISADDGTEIFSIEKTDAVTVGAYAAGIQVYDGEYEGIRTFLIPVNVVTDSHPKMYYRQSLNDAVGWRSETEINAEHGDMTVEWSGVSGEWHCLVFIPASRVSGFFKFTYEKPGSTLIRHGAPMDVSGGIMCTDGIHKVRPVYNNGSITWEVVQ